MNNKALRQHGKPQTMMERIGFKEVIKAKQAIAELNNVYQSPAYTVSAGAADKAKIYIDVSPAFADYVYLNYKEYII